MAKFSFKGINKAVIHQMVEMYLNGMRPRDLAQWFQDEHGMTTVTAQRIHDPLLVMATKEGYLQSIAQPEPKLERELALHYHKAQDSLHVVNARKPLVRQQVCRRAALLTLELIKEVARHKKDVVRVGLGGGVTMHETAEELAKLLHGEPLLPPIAFHALASGMNVHNLISSPSAFLTYFMDLPMQVEFVGLYGPAIVDTDLWTTVKRWPGMVEPFAYKDEIDIILTGIATSKDEHGALKQFAKVGKTKGFKLRPLENAGWQGDLFYEAFGQSGPLKIDTGMRAVTLFGLRELKRIASQKGRHVIVVAAPCDGCGKPKTKALRPLLGRRELAVWNHLVLDVATAKELLPLPGSAPPPGSEKRKRRVPVV